MLLSNSKKGDKPVSTNKLLQKKILNSNQDMRRVTSSPGDFTETSFLLSVSLKKILSLGKKCFV